MAGVHLLGLLIHYLVGSEGLESEEKEECILCPELLKAFHDPET